MAKKHDTRANARHWIVTQHDLERFWGPHTDPTDHVAFRYMVYQIESSPTTGSWHVQGFIQFTQCVKSSTVANLFGGGAHVEVAHHPDEARAYCMKAESRVTVPEERGVWEPTWARGHRVDLSIAKRRIRELGNYRDCLDEDALDKITSQYPKWVSDQLTMVSRTIRPVPIVTVYYGPTGTGKTLRCHQNNPGIHEVRWDNGFINYTGQKLVLFDEFDKAPWPFGTFLKLLDPYPFQVNIKNGYIYWEPSHVFITATEHPSEWFIGQKGYREEYLPQLMRRLTVIVDTSLAQSPDALDMNDDPE